VIYTITITTTSIITKYSSCTASVIVTQVSTNIQTNIITQIVSNVATAIVVDTVMTTDSRANQRRHEPSLGLEDSFGLPVSAYTINSASLILSHLHSLETGALPRESEGSSAAVHTLFLKRQAKTSTNIAGTATVYVTVFVEVTSTVYGTSIIIVQTTLSLTSTSYPDAQTTIHVTTTTTLKPTSLPPSLVIVTSSSTVTSNVANTGQTTGESSKLGQQGWIAIGVGIAVFLLVLLAVIIWILKSRMTKRNKNVDAAPKSGPMDSFAGDRESHASPSTQFYPASLQQGFHNVNTIPQYNSPTYEPSTTHSQNGSQYTHNHYNLLPSLVSGSVVSGGNDRTRYAGSNLPATYEASFHGSNGPVHDESVRALSPMSDFSRVM
jgi:hypothetical protein